MSPCRQNSVRDKVDLFRQKHTLQTECESSQKARVVPVYGVISFYRAGYCHRLMSGKSISAILRKE